MLAGIMIFVWLLVILVLCLFVGSGAHKEKLLHSQKLKKRTVCMRTFVENISDDEEEFIWSGIYYIPKEDKESFIKRNTYISEFYKSYVESDITPTDLELEKIINNTKKEIEDFKKRLVQLNEMLDFYILEKDKLELEENYEN